jgi:mRNA-degrading endonuclease toxin of MazEF toxin-antitoxin module
VNAWEIYSCDLGWSAHPVVIVSHPARAARREFVEVLDCTSQRPGRPPAANEVLLDSADGLDGATLCKCDCVFAVPRAELRQHRGNVTLERRRQIVRTIIQSHGWNLL